MATFRKVFALQCKKKTSGNTLRFLTPTGVRGWVKHFNTNGNIVRLIDENRGYGVDRESKGRLMNNEWVVCKGGERGTIR